MAESNDSDATRARRPASREDLTRRREPPPHAGTVARATDGDAAKTRARSAPATPNSLRRPIDAGTCIRGRYVLEQLIGSGGMGQVWKARDLVSEQARDPNPYVAIKLLNVDFEADPDAFVSLQRESRKAQELAHPNVITVFTFDIDDDGSHRAFMTMELLEGEPLDALIRSHRSGVTGPRARTLIKGMARGLEHAHKKGIVHADFKPGNVFLTTSGEPKVLDFGIARAANIAGIERAQDSFDAGRLGGLTLAYASLQMIDGLPPHPADDVYALGLVVYELLTGRHPFDRQSAAEAAQKALTAPRIRGLKRHEWRALSRALEYDARRRWQNAGEFLRAFEGKRVAAVAIAGVAVTLALVAGGFWYKAYRENGPAVPLESLSAADQASFHGHIASAEGEWRLVQQGYSDQVEEAVHEYALAYDLHPRDPDAVAGLKKTADYILNRSRTAEDARARHEHLKQLQTQSPFYVGYRPLAAAIEETE